MQRNFLTYFPKNLQLFPKSDTVIFYQFDVFPVTRAIGRYLESGRIAIGIATKDHAAVVSDILI